MKTIVVIDSIHPGGISTSLIPFLKELSRYSECDLLSFYSGNINLFHELPDKVHLLQTNAVLSMVSCVDENLNRRRVVRLIKWFLDKCMRLLGSEFARRPIFLFTPRFSGYDLAISYRQDVGAHDLFPGCNGFGRCLFSALCI